MKEEVRALSMAAIRMLRDEVTVIDNCIWIDDAVRYCEGAVARLLET